MITNNSASDNTGSGIGCKKGLIIDNVANNNEVGIFMTNGPGNILGNTASGNTFGNFRIAVLENYIANILVDRNSAQGLGINYFQGPGVIGIQYGLNAGWP